MLRLDLKSYSCNKDRVKKDQVYQAVMHFDRSGDNDINLFMTNIYNQPNQTYMWMILHNLEGHEMFESEDAESILLTFLKSFARGA